jgi:hypothetical protein
MSQQESNQQQPSNEEATFKEGEQHTYNVDKIDASEDRDNLYLNAETTLQTPEEFETDKHKPHNEGDKVTTTGTNDHDTNGDGLAGTDRAGTAERKDYGGASLNQGLEEQGAQTTYND